MTLKNITLMTSVVVTFLVSTGFILGITASIVEAKSSPDSLPACLIEGSVYIGLSGDSSVYQVDNMFFETAYLSNDTKFALGGVRVAGGINITFDASDNYPSPPGPGGAVTGSVTTGNLSSASRFVLECTEPMTNTTFTEEVLVEVIPDYEEI